PLYSPGLTGRSLIVQRNELSSFPQSFFPSPGVAVAGDSIPLLPPCGQVAHVRSGSAGISGAKKSFGLPVVTGDPTDHPPVITSTAPAYAQVGNRYLYTVVATAADNDPLTYSVTGPDGMDFDSFGHIQWTPTASQIGP